MQAVDKTLVVPELTAVLAAYLIGSIPFGLILTRLTGAGDLRAIGSGNIGATNVLRTGRKGLAAATLLLDMAKGAAAVLLTRWWLTNSLAPLVIAGSAEDTLTIAPAGLAVVLGHCFPVWLLFRGGKGVATMLGVSFAIDFKIGVVAALVWLVAARLTRVSSVGGMGSAVAAPMASLAFAWLTGWSDEGFRYLVFAAALAALALVVVARHRENLARLLAGTEPRMGRG